MNRAEQIHRAQQLRSNFEGLLQDVSDACEFAETSGKWDDYTDACQDLERWLRQHADEFPPSPPRHRTRDEIQALKAEWLADPDCENWMLEDTHGYECHSPELLAFRLQTELERIVNQFKLSSDDVWQFKPGSKEVYESRAMRIAVFVMRNIKRLEVKP